MKRKIRDAVVTFFIYCKRLLHRPAFIVLTAMIPLVTAVLVISFSSDSAVLRIGICSEGSNTGDKIVAELLMRNSIVSFTEYKSSEEAKKDVIADKIHGAWIFPKDLDSRISQNAENRTSLPLVKVIEQEDSIPLKLSHELLYGCLHPYVVYSNYEHFTEKKYPNADTSKEALRYHYDNGTPVGEVLIMKVVGKEEKAETDNNFLTYPLRGILSLLCILCGIASAMFFLDDKAIGQFDGMPRSKHIFPAFASCLAGTALSAPFVIISVFIAGTHTDILSEIFAMLLFVICVCGFCLVCATLCGKSSRLGVITPFLMMIMMVQSPVFLNMDSLRPLWFLFPQSFYLYAVYDGTYMVYMIIYAAVSLAIAFLLNLLFGRLPKKSMNG